ncbi:hypothetical protein SH528x_000862 [Novipirellula sp. SH528]
MTSISKLELNEVNSIQIAAKTAFYLNSLPRIPNHAAFSLSPR